MDILTQNVYGVLPRTNTKTNTIPFSFPIGINKSHTSNNYQRLAMLTTQKGKKLFPSVPLLLLFFPSIFMTTFLHKDITMPSTSALIYLSNQLINFHETWYERYVITEKYMLLGISL
jgi:hypothetical protein